MSNEKMREDFEAWARRNLTEVTEQSFKRMPVLERLYENGHMEALWQCCQAFTAATQRDAMAVAEAVRVAMVQSCESWPGIVEATKRVDLAAIVKAVRPSKPEPVNQQLLAALKDIANDYADRFDIASSSTNPGIKIVIEQARAAIAAAEAAQPASAQQQGEPVAWAAFASNGNCRIWFGDKASADNWAEATGIHGPLTPLYTAPPAPACSVPDGWRLVPVEPTEEMIRGACLAQSSEKYESYESWWDDHSSGVSERIRSILVKDYHAMLAAAPKGGA